MAPPFPLFVIGLIEIFLPEAQRLPLWFVFYNTPNIIGSENFKEIAFSSQDWIRKRFFCGKDSALMED
jgi:hypothetical protein